MFLNNLKNQNVNERTSYQLNLFFFYFFSNKWNHFISSLLQLAQGGLDWRPNSQQNRFCNTIGLNLNKLLDSSNFNTQNTTKGNQFQLRR